MKWAKPSGTASASFRMASLMPLYSDGSVTCPPFDWASARYTPELILLICNVRVLAQQPP